MVLFQRVKEQVMKKKKLKPFILLIYIMILLKEFVREICLATALK